MGIRSYFQEKKAEAERQQAKAHHWKMCQKAADMAISEMVREMTPDGRGSYIYAADVQRVGLEHFNLTIETHDAHAAIHHRLVYRGYNPSRFAPVFDYDEWTPNPRDPEPCKGYDYAGENEWCRACGWNLDKHPEYIEETQGEK